MLTRWADLWPDYDRTFEVMDNLQRLFSDLETYRRPGFSSTARGSWPPVNLHDSGEELVLSALVPGMSEKDLTITANQDMINIAGERKTSVPEGHSVHRQERGSVRFSRSFTFPCKCDLERVSASVKDGVLTVKVAKAPEAKPRQITITAK